MSGPSLHFAERPRAARPSSTPQTHSHRSLSSHSSAHLLIGSHIHRTHHPLPHSCEPEVLACSSRAPRAKQSDQGFNFIRTPPGWRACGDRLGRLHQQLVAHQVWTSAPVSTAPKTTLPHDFLLLIRVVIRPRQVCPHQPGRFAFRARGLFMPEVPWGAVPASERAPPPAHEFGAHPGRARPSPPRTTPAYPHRRGRLRTPRA